MPQTLNVYTIQLAQWRKLGGKDIALIDTTVKSGNKAFAPTWEIVTAIKSCKLSSDEYAVEYKRLMEKSIQDNPSEWDTLLNSGSIALACYCPANVFCHRYILRCIVKALCEQKQIQFVDKGEFK